MFVRNALLYSNVTWQFTYVSIHKGLKNWEKLQMLPVLSCSSVSTTSCSEKQDSAFWAAENWVGTAAELGKMQSLKCKDRKKIL